MRHSWCAEGVQYTRNLGNTAEIDAEVARFRETCGIPNGRMCPSLLEQSMRA
jgi:hypothetical protein